MIIKQLNALLTQPKECNHLPTAPSLSLSGTAQLVLILLICLRLSLPSSVPSSSSSSVSLPLTLIGSFMGQLNRKTQILCFVTETIMTSVQAVHNS